MRYFVYVLRSLKNNDIYVGSTENIERELNYITLESEVDERVQAVEIIRISGI